MSLASTGVWRLIQDRNLKYRRAVIAKNKIAPKSHALMIRECQTAVGDSALAVTERAFRFESTIGRATTCGDVDFATVR